jgi:hypothetical protein
MYRQSVVVIFGENPFFDKERHQILGGYLFSGRVVVKKISYHLVYSSNLMDLFSDSMARCLYLYQFTELCRFFRQ